MADTAGGRAEPAAEGLLGWRRRREAACMEKWDTPSWQVSLVHGNTWISLSSLPSWPSEGGEVRQRSNREDTGSSSLLIPVLTPSLTAPSPDPSSSSAVWNVPGLPRLVQSPTRPLPCCFISRPLPSRGSILGHCPVAPCATRVPRRHAGDCPSLFVRSARPGRWRSPVHQRQRCLGAPQGQQPPVRCFHDNRPKHRLPRADRSTLASRTRRSKEDVRPCRWKHRELRWPQGTAPSRKPWEKSQPGPSTALGEGVDPAAESHTPGHGLPKPQPKPWQLFLFPHRREKDRSPFKPGGKPPAKLHVDQNPAPLAHR